MMGQSHHVHFISRVFYKAHGLGLGVVLFSLLFLSGCLYDEAAKTCFDYTAEGEGTGECVSVASDGGNVVIVTVSPADEIVVLGNQGLVDQVMDNWTLGPENAPDGEKYIFGAFTLAVGKYVRVHAGSGTEADTASDLYWEGSEHWVSDDTAHLKDSLGTIIDTCNNADPCWGG